jgi:hypothetical protein
MGKNRQRLVENAPPPGDRRGSIPTWDEIGEDPDKAHDFKWGERCRWPECEEYCDFGYAVHLCIAHVYAVKSAFAKHDRREAERQSRDSEIRAAADAERQEMVDKVTEQINAGTLVTANRALIPGWVYYIQIDGLIKIGYAADVAKRMRSYPPTAQLLAVEPGTLKVEKARHQHFGKHLAKGREWFSDVPELREWIDTLVTQYGTADHMAHKWGREEREPVVANKRIRNRRY